MKEPRSHIEGATPLDRDLELRHRPRPVQPASPARPPDRRRPPAAARLDRGPAEPDARAAGPGRRRRASAGAGESARDARPATRRGPARSSSRSPPPTPSSKGQADALEAKAAAAQAAGRDDEARQARAEAARLHAPPIRLEMTFNIYRTTKGRLGEPVQAEIDVTNPRTGANWQRHHPDPGVLHQQAGVPGRRCWPARAGTSGSRSVASARTSTWAWPRATCTSWPTRATSARTSSRGSSASGSRRWS